MSEPTALNVAIAAGGTAGHINPALALAEELVERGHRVTFYGQPARLEGTLVPQAGFELVGVEVSGIDRERPWTALSAVWKMGAASRSLRRRFREQGAPDVAAGFGAYVEMPLLTCCRKLGVPYVLHEQNSVPGLANKALAPHAAAVCISVPAAQGAFEHEGGRGPQIVLTGNPVRRSVVNADREAGRRRFGIAPDQTMLLVFGGSLGAQHINEGVCALKDELLSRGNLVVVHSTGAEGYDGTVASLNLSEDERKRWKVVPYISEMGEALAAADAVLSRAGASSIAEIAAIGVPSLLVPYPHATADHQTTNARFLTDAGAAAMVTDDAIGTRAFQRLLFSLVDDADLRERMRLAAADLGATHAAQSLADQVEEAARRR